MTDEVDESQTESLAEIYIPIGTLIGWSWIVKHICID